MIENLYDIISREEMMNELLRRLSGGDLRTDGRANKVAEEVIENPQLLNKLVKGLSESDNVIRARTAHALEKISRADQEISQGLVSQFINVALKGEVPMVKWYLAMIFGNMAFPEKEIDLVLSTLFRLLNDESVFVRAWSISSLCITGRANKAKRKEILRKIKTLQNDESIAVRTRVIETLDVLENENKPLPGGWSKSGGSKALQKRGMNI